MIRRFVELLRLVESTILVLVLTSMVLVAAYQVVARNFFDTGLLWGDALVRVLVLWIALVGAMVASRNDDHIRMDILSRFVGPKVGRQLKRFTSLFTCVVLVVFSWYSLQFVLFEYEDQMIAFASVPAWVCESILPIGALVMGLRYFLHTFNPP